MNAVGHASREAEAARPVPRILATLCFSADKDFLALARCTTMHVAGLLGLAFSRVVDLRLAVDEACALFLAPAAPLVPAASAAPAKGDGGGVGGLALVFADLGDELRIIVSGPAPVRELDFPDGLGWTLLCALVAGPRWEVEGDVGILTLTEPVPSIRR
ncbi:hypothetical protein KDL01_24910 [Actinospica durhamensis]|uniref:Uncharacterized protein n=1 Tax=Actinospica durhamensis TaxID=1508375 RepID=A0A941EST6_9ACTN|nr:hypothetical protein [Actinospica durhamensis]MBR7836543.1 hypothetical protein [Actinospica durhamensis]